VGSRWRDFGPGAKPAKVMIAERGLDGVEVRERIAFGLDAPLRDVVHFFGGLMRVGPASISLFLEGVAIGAGSTCAAAAALGLHGWAGISGWPIHAEFFL